MGNGDPLHVCGGFAEIRIRDDILHHAWSVLSSHHSLPPFSVYGYMPSLFL